MYCLNIDDVRLLKFFVWLRGTRAALVQMDAVQKPAKLAWDFSLAEIDSIRVAGYFAGHEMDAKRRENLVLKELMDASHFPTLFFKKIKDLPSSLRKTLKKFFTFLYKWLQGKQTLRSEEGRILRNPFFNVGEAKMDFPNQHKGIKK